MQQSLRQGWKTHTMTNQHHVKNTLETPTSVCGHSWQAEHPRLWQGMLRRCRRAYSPSCTWLRWHCPDACPAFSIRLPPSDPRSWLSGLDHKTQHWHELRKAPQPRVQSRESICSGFSTGILSNVEQWMAQQWIPRKWHRKRPSISRQTNGAWNCSNQPHCRPWLRRTDHCNLGQRRFVVRHGLLTCNF